MSSRKPHPIRPLSLVLGLLVGLASLVLLQQFGVADITTWAIVRLLLFGLAFGLFLPLIAYALGSWRAKRKAADAEGAQP